MRDGSEMSSKTVSPLSPSDVERLERRIAELERENEALRAMEEDLQYQHEITRTIAENATPLLFMMDAEGRCTFMNAAAERGIGYTLTEIQGRPLHGLVHHTRPDGTPYPQSECPLDRALIENHQIRAHEDVFIRRNGDFFPVLCSASPIVKGGELVGTVIEVRDLTEEKKVEAERGKLLESLELERSRLASIFLQSPAFIATLRGPGHVFEMANPFYDQLVGHRDIIGKPVREALPEVADQGFVELLDQVYQSGQPFVGNEIPILLQREEKGPLEQHFLNFVYQPLFEADGSVSGIFAHGVDLTEHVRTTEALREAGRRKDEFLAMLGHELRNPLAPIRNAVQILRQTRNESVLERVRDIIDRQTAHMVRLVDDLLDVSRISRGKILLRKERLDLTELVRETVEDHRPDLMAGGLALDLNLPGRSLSVEGDRTRLSQALGNLLNNAAKFTDPGGRITVDLRVDLTADQEGRIAEAAIAKIMVSDTGIGMEPEMLKRLFETFSQADRSLDRSRGGLGLGLALVKGLIELHGGEVRAESEGLGHGSRFTLSLPLAASGD
jgi:PAS domain S-box-containing protein